MTSWLNTVVGGVIALAIVGSLTVLGYHGTVDGKTISDLYFVLAGGAAGGVVGHVVAKSSAS